MQAGMLFNGFARLGDEIQQIVIRPPAGISTATLREAFAAAVARHVTLRTTITSGADGPKCVQHDVSPLPSSELRTELPLDSALPDVLASDRRRGLDVSRVPVFRLLRVCARDGEALVWTFHHAHLDGRSIELVLADVCRRALGQDVPSEPSPDPRLHVVAALDESRRAAARAYFARELDGLEDVPTLGVGSAEPSRHRELTTYVHADVMRALSALGETFEFTWATAIHAAWALVVSRYSYASDVVFGITRACRHVAPGSARTVGCLINTVPMRLRLDPTERVVDLLARARRISVEQRAFETLGLREIADAAGLGDPRVLVRSVVVCEGHTLEAKMHAEVPATSSWRFRLQGRSAGPLTIAVYRTPDGGAQIAVEYDTAEVHAAVAEALGPALADLLRRFVDSPLSPLAELETGGPLAILEGRSAPSPSESVGELLSGVLTGAVDRVAIVDVASGARLTYGSLRARAEALAKRLAHDGLRPGGVVAVLARRRAETVVAWLACQLGGLVYLPVDPAYPPERTRFVLEDAGARVVVGAERADSLPAHLRRLDESDTPLRPHQAPSVDPEAIAYVLYTSGSTGQPKGVRVPHRALAAHARAAVSAYQLDASDRVLQFASPSFDVYLEEVVPTLLAGGRVVIRDEGASRSIDQLLRLVEREGITILQLPTAFFHELTADLERNRRTIPSSVRAVIVGGERLSADACRRFRRVEPSLRLVNAYGPTEVTITATAYDVPREVPEVVPIGTPIGACRAYVVDVHGRVAPLGARGELALGGPQVASGYHARPEETARRFVPDPSDPARGVVYRTGDLVRSDPSGGLVFEGRADAQVKVRGFRIELGEVEAALERDEAVAEAVAKVLETPGGERVLAAFAVVRIEGTSGTDLLRRLAQRVPQQLVPSRVFVVGSLPRTPGGKVDRRALVWPRSDTDREAAPDDSSATPTELRVLALFREVLGDDATLDDGFFDRGGTSIRALRLISRIEEQLGAKPTVATLVANPSPRRLAAWIDNHEGGAPPGELVLLNGVDAGASPLYCVVGLNVYTTLARSIGRRPVYGIFVPEETDFPGGRISVERLADVYLRALASHGDGSPRILCGVSFGALVAFEMAQRLSSIGSPPDLLIMLDPRLPSMWQEVPFESVRNLIARVRQDPLGVPERVRSRLRRLFTAGASETEAAGANAADQERWLAREAAYARALEDYEPRIRRYPGLAQIYIARDETPARLAEVEARWRALVGPSSQLEHVPGTHGAILQEPYVHQIARRLDRALRERKSVSLRAVRDD